MKRLFSVVLGVLVVSMAIISCKDDFNEQDFLKLQSDLKLKQDSIARARNASALDSASAQEIDSYIAALNAAGELMSVTVLITENNVPVPDATVTVTSGAPLVVSGGRTNAVYTGTTSSTGHLVLPQITIGHNTFRVTKAGYVTTVAIIDFGTPDAPEKITTTTVINGVTSTKTTFLPPSKRHEAIAFQTFSNTTSPTSSSTVDGHVTIQSNVMTVVEEPAADIEVRGDFSGLAWVAENDATASVNIVSYTLEDGTLGTATTDANGNFTMVVPASSDPYTLNLVFPTITMDQTIAIAAIDGTPLAGGPEIRTDIAAVFGPQAGAYDAVPSIYGAKVVTGTPAPPGRGFGATFDAVSRGMGTPTISTLGKTVSNNTVWNFVSRGSGFTSSPDVSFSGGGGTGAEAETTLRGFVTSANITNGGAGYTASTDYDVVFTYTDAGGNQNPMPGMLHIDVTSDAGGVLPVGPLTLPTFTTGFPNGTPFNTPGNIQGFGVRVMDDGTLTPATPTTAAAISATRTVELGSVIFTESGSGYTSAPTMTLTSGGGTQPAIFNIDVFRTQWDMTLNAGGATVPYTILPSDFAFVYASDGYASETIEEPAEVDEIAPGFSTSSSGNDLVDLLTTDGSNISRINASNNLRTSLFWETEPTLVQIDQTVEPAVVYADVSSTGTVSVIDPGTGLFSDDTEGSGYNAFPFSVVPSATGAPGTGAIILPVTSFDDITKEVFWSGSTIVSSGGTGFKEELNEMGTSAQQASSSSVTSFDVVAGRTYKVEYKYGSGNKVMNVAGNFRR